MNKELYTLEYSIPQKSYHIGNIESSTRFGFQVFLENTHTGYMVILLSKNKNVLNSICGFLQNARSDRTQPFSKDQIEKILKLVLQHQDQLVSFDSSKFEETIRSLLLED